MFDKNFVFGTATASFQIEGAYNEDGKGLSVWDVSCMEKGFVTDGHNGNVACDHYHRYKEDVAMMKKLGLKAYRFSISWCRILPNGVGEVNEKGLEFYDKLIDELLANGIEPYVTLFHWDYPYELFCRGGWLNDDSPKWFADYVKIVVDRYSDRVSNWFTLNEPSCFIGYGHRQRVHAPHLGLDMKSSMRAMHNALLAHGMAVSVIRSNAKLKPTIGFAPQGHISYPVENTEANIEAARAHMFSVRDSSMINDSMWMDPVYLGKYPADMLEKYGEFMPKIGQNDMKIISQPLDFCGINSYLGTPIAVDENGVGYEAERAKGYHCNASGWPIDCDAFYWGARFFYERYGLPVVVTENGMSENDWVSLDGSVHDAGRIDFLDRTLRSLDKAFREGIPVAGYFLWSLMDNMEWNYGYSQRFGIVHVDFETQKRTIKDSGYWYSDLIKSITK